MTTRRPTWRHYHRGLMAEAAADVPSSSLESANTAMSKTKRRNGRSVNGGRARRKREDHRQARLFDTSPSATSVAPTVKLGGVAAADLLGFAQGRRFVTI